MIQRAEHDGYVFNESDNGKSVRKGANRALGNTMVMQVESGFLKLNTKEVTMGDDLGKSKS